MKRRLTTKNLAVIFGGIGKEHEISVKSAEFIISNLDREKFDPIPIFITKEGEWLIADKGIPCYPAKTELCGGLMTKEGFIPLLSAFPILHGNFGEDGKIQGALASAGIPFVGCETTAGAVCSDKAFTKIIAESLGIPTAPWILSLCGSENSLKEAKKRAELSFGYPMFIKPCNSGSSIGASKVFDASDFEAAYLDAKKIDDRVIIEKAVLVKLELECACLMTKSKQLLSKTGFVRSSNSFYDYNEKYESNSAFVGTHPDIEERFSSAVSVYSALLFENLSLRQISRIDYFLTEKNEIVFNEINTMPGFTKSSLYPRLMEESGIPPRELITELVLGSLL